MKELHANGKLLLTGEYAVLDGAKAIGLPTKRGQSLQISEGKKPETIQWKAFLPENELWFEAEINSNSFTVASASDQKSAENLAFILQKTAELNPKAILNKSFHIETYLEFPKDWGLGSSSTLIALLSKCFDVNPYKLLERTFGGSGYDISCAMMPRPQFFELTKKDRKISFIQLNPEITKHIYFVYLNQKQNSRNGIDLYRSVPKSDRLIKSISDISTQIADCDNLADFEDLIYVHEQLISSHLDLETVKEKLFQDYTEGEIKSLGAWGGDFFLVTSEAGFPEYFLHKGYDVIFSYDELIVN